MDNINKVINHHVDKANAVLVKEGVDYLNGLVMSGSEEEKAALVEIAAKIANDGDLLVPLGVTDATAKVFAEFANRTYEGRYSFSETEEVLTYV